jgi:antitoxin VapB
MKTKIFKSGNSLAVRLPKELELPCGTVSIHREGRKIIIEELTENGWPEGFFESVRISRKATDVIKPPTLRKRCETSPRHQRLHRHAPTILKTSSK